VIKSAHFDHIAIRISGIVEEHPPNIIASLRGHLSQIKKRMVVDFSLVSGNCKNYFLVPRAEIDLNADLFAVGSSENFGFLHGSIIK